MANHGAPICYVGFHPNQVRCVAAAPAPFLILPERSQVIRLNEPVIDECVGDEFTQQYIRSLLTVPGLSSINLESRSITVNLCHRTLLVGEQERTKLQVYLVLLPYLAARGWRIISLRNLAFFRK